MQAQLEYTTNIKPSRWLVRLQLSILALSSFSLIYTVVYVDDFIMGIVLITVYLIILSYSFISLRFLLQLKKLVRFDSGLWMLELKNSNSFTNLSLRASYVCETFIILNFSHSAYFFNKTVFLAFDSIGDEQFRQLKVYCRDPKTFLQ